MQTVLLSLHFIGFILGFSGGIGSIVVEGLRRRATQEGASALARFPAAMAKVEWVGVALLVATGAAMMQTKYDGAWSAMPWTFWAKMVAVVVLIGLLLPLTRLETRFARGDKAVEGAMLKLGPAVGLTALTALVLAVITFE